MGIDDKRKIALVWPQNEIFKTIYHWPTSSPIDKSLEFLVCRFINQIFCFCLQKHQLLCLRSVLNLFVSLQYVLLLMKLYWLCQVNVCPSVNVIYRFSKN